MSQPIDGTLGAQGLLQSVRKRIVFVAELSAVLSAAAFLVSSLAGIAVFAFWGLPYLQIATPSDVVMSGLQMLLWGLVVCSAWAGLTYLVGRFVAARWTGVLLAVAAFFLSIYFFNQTDQGVLVQRYELLVYLACIAPIFVAARRLLIENGPLRVCLALVFLAIIGILGGSIIAQFVTDGFLNASITTIHDGSECKPLWLGAESTVLECGGDRRVVPREGLVLIVG